MWDANYIFLVDDSVTRTNGSFQQRGSFAGPVGCDRRIVRRNESPRFSTLHLCRPVMLVTRYYKEHVIYSDHSRLLLSLGRRNRHLYA
jgi:hypothetical protein